MHVFITLGKCHRSILCEMHNSFTLSKLYCFPKKWMTFKTAGYYAV